MVTTTKSQVESVLNALNNQMKPSKYNFRLKRRYEYYAIEIYYNDELHSTLISGLSKGKAWDISIAMLRAIEYKGMK